MTQYSNDSKARKEAALPAQSKKIPQVLAGCAALLAAGAVWGEALPAPAFSGVLRPIEDPISVDAGPLGSVYISGQVSALGIFQNNTVNAPGTGNRSSRFDIGNAQLEVQTTEGPLQFYLQAGTYALPSLGNPYVQSSKAVDQLYGPLPVAYAKVVVSPELNVMVGALPTLIGAESTFTFQNVNIQRGLLWNQEPAISRGVQVSYASGPVSASLSLNDGYYSNKYNWVSGSLSYAIDTSNSVSFVGGGSFSRNAESSSVTPLAQNNGYIVNLIYTHSAGALSLTPYFQYSRVGSHPAIGLDRSAETFGGALLVKYDFSSEWSLGARAEYIKARGKGCDEDTLCTPTNLLYGANSGAWSLTLTPTFQTKRFFARGELAYVRIQKPGVDAAFGGDGTRRGQVRALAEVGLRF
ncbi:porin [Pandoraea bronchicola]|uniref:Porin n=1 Tax=Pandoraea bronchicola TaxID=2508287 RepID=A0A5E5BXW8_9BURK|nr:porin [Pandoraea bronchicola]VVE89173.1 hypothetical protein PBR20603_03139 [Pandoraea bronchicola]